METIFCRAIPAELISLLEEQDRENRVTILTYEKDSLMTEEGIYLAKVEERIKDRFGDRLSIYRSASFFLEIVPKGVDKAVARELIRKQMHCSRKELAACGDGFNDHSMIEYACLGVSMDNGQDRIKSAADVIASSSDNDGVAWVVDTCLLPMALLDEKTSRKIHNK